MVTSRRGAYVRTALSAAAAIAGLRKRKSKTVTMKRKAPVRTRTLTKTRNTRRTKNTVQAQGEYSKVSTNLGKKPKRDLRAAWKYLNQNISRSVYGHRNYNSFGSISGAVTLANTSPTPTSGSLSVPLHLYELNSVPNVTTGGVILIPNILYLPVFSSPTDTATISWQQASAFNLEDSSADGAQLSSYANSSDTLDWLSIKMLCYTPLTIPCRWEINIMRISDQRLNPDTANTSKFCTAIYQSYIKNFIKSPIETSNSAYKRYFKTIYTSSWIMTPKESTENVANIMREVNIFLRVNQKCSYNWGDEDLMGMSTVDTQKNYGANKLQTHPRARLYLSIRAQAVNGTAWTQSTMPSYDIAIRAKHSQLTT